MKNYFPSHGEIMYLNPYYVNLSTRLLFSALANAMLPHRRNIACLFAGLGAVEQLEELYGL